MTVQCRLRIMIAVAALFSPACISIRTTPAEIIPPDVAPKPVEIARKTDFGVLRPGDSIATKSLQKDANVAQKPQHTGPGSTPSTDPVVLTTPSGGGSPSVEPGPLQLASGRDKAVPEHPLLAATRAFIEGRPERAIEVIAGLDRTNQDFILALLPALLRGATADIANDPVAITELVEQLRLAATRMEPQANLQVDAAVFCDDVVYGFSRYVPRSENKAYRPNEKAQFYIEVRNLVSQPTVGPRKEAFLTHARATVEIRDAHSKLVPQPDPADSRRHYDVWKFEEKRFTQAPFRDFHMVYTFPVPSQPGVYTITVLLSDATGRRAVKTTPVQFLVAGP